MTEKRFRVLEHCLRSSYGIEAENWLVTNDNHSVVLNNKGEAHMVANMSNDVINKLNALHEENEQLKGSLNFCKRNAKRLHNDKKELINENEQLKQELQECQNKHDTLIASYNGLNCEYEWLQEENNELNDEKAKLKQENLSLENELNYYKRKEKRVILND